VAACILLMGLAALPALSADVPAGKVLFICTGNFFRSAFAEHYFNFLAIQNRRLEPGDPRRKRVFWVAESRGLDLAQLSPSQRAARMSAFAVERLKQLKVPVPMVPGPLPAHAPTVLTVPDLEKSDRVIALHAPTHRPMLRSFMEKHGARAPSPLLDRVTYWNIEDVVGSPAIPLTPAQQAARALDEVQRAVEQLFASL
jgi:protein-tyrosine phosphatase